MKRAPIEREFYERDTVNVAKEILGNYLIKGEKVVKITETEAYVGPEDKASHAYTKKRETVFPLWGPGGFTYVHLIYGMYFMLNISAEKNGYPGSVLIRGGVAISEPSNVHFNGPGKLTRFLDINRTHNNIDVTKKGEIYLTRGDSVSEAEILTSSRIGIDYAQEYKDKLWRFYIKP